MRRTPAFPAIVDPAAQGEVVLDPFTNPDGPATFIEGAAGTGKTRLAQCLANQLWARYFNLPFLILDQGAWSGWVAGAWPYLSPEGFSGLAVNFHRAVWDREPLADDARQTGVERLVTRLREGIPRGVFHPRVLVVEEPSQSEWRELAPLVQDSRHNRIAVVVVARDRSVFPGGALRGFPNRIDLGHNGEPASDLPGLDGSLTSSLEQVTMAHSDFLYADGHREPQRYRLILGSAEQAFATPARESTAIAQET